MLISHLIDHFDESDELPVSVNAVRDKLVNLGVKDTIRFSYPNMDAGKIRGLLHRYETIASPYNSEGEVISDVIIAANMGEENERWQRLVAVKELLHIADCHRTSAETTDAVNTLFANFALPPELRFGPSSKAQPTNSFLNDNTKFYLALAVLVPASARSALRPKKGSRMPESEIAEFAGIPSRYADQVLSPTFDEVVEEFLKWETKIELADEEAKYEAAQATKQAAAE